MHIYHELLGDLFFDRTHIVRASLRTYLGHCVRFHAGRAYNSAEWCGDAREGSFFYDNGQGDYSMVAWSESGVVGFGYDLGCGPREVYDLSEQDITGGAEDVRCYLRDMPKGLERTMQNAVAGLWSGRPYGEKLAGVGFWLAGDDVGGTLLDPDSYEVGGENLARWCLDHLSEAHNAELCALADRVMHGPVRLDRKAHDALGLVLDDQGTAAATERLLERAGVQVSWPKVRSHA